MIYNKHVPGFLGDNIYIEIIRDENNQTFELRELEHPPITMSQVRQDEQADGEEPDAEYVNLNETNLVNDTLRAITEALPVDSEMSDNEEPTEEPLSPEDENIRKEWGGTCMVTDWMRCNKIENIIMLEVINTPFQKKDLRMNCLTEPTLCLRNGWTANR